MFWRLVLLFTLVPIVELWLLLTIGSWMGFWPTFLTVIGTAFLGSYLSKREGLRVWREYQKALSEMRMPEEGIVSGLLVLVGAVLLITPGVLTDVTGLLLMIPPIRRFVARQIEKRLRASFEAGSADAVVFETFTTPQGTVRRAVRVSSQPKPAPAQPSAPDEVLEGEVVDSRGRVLRSVDR